MLAETDETCQRLRALAQSMLPPEISFACLRAGEWPLLGNEIPAMARAVPKRQAEFAGGRAAARRAMIALGLDPVAIPVGPDRAPVWPYGIAGSISHAGGICIAAVRRGPGLIGLDLESDEPLDPELHETVLTQDESDLDAKLVFCIKEAAYKAQYPVSRMLYGFEGMTVTLDGKHWRARFLQDVPPFRPGNEITGLWGQTDGFILSVAF